jgi:type II secretory pathway pseudopilin PulG
MRKMLQTRLADERGFGLVEALIALTILVIGLVAVSGLSLASADQARIANWRSEQATAGQMALEAVQLTGWAGAVSGSDTVSIAGHPYAITYTVTDLTPRVRQVVAEVAAVGDVGARVFTTRLYRPRPLPPENPPYVAGEETPPDSGTVEPPPDSVKVEPPPDSILVVDVPSDSVIAY